MKESISYSFLLNIIILFIVVCVAIVMGIFSYYRAFRANTIVISSIEKYEGYNCLSAQEAAQKLNGISYNVPFTVKCKTSDGNCMTDSDANYKVVSYNLNSSSGENNDKFDTVYKSLYKSLSQEDIQEKKYKFENWNSTDEEKRNYSSMNSEIDCVNNVCESTKSYQYGVYTYMYVDLPVVSSLIRIPFFSKTKELHEFRNLVYATGKAVGKIYDSNYLPEWEIPEWEIKENKNIDILDSLGGAMLQNYADLLTFGEPLNEYFYGENSSVRSNVQTSFAGNVTYNAIYGAYDMSCGFIIDYSNY